MWSSRFLSSASRNSSSAWSKNNKCISSFASRYSSNNNNESTNQISNFMLASAGVIVAASSYDRLGGCRDGITALESAAVISANIEAASMIDGVKEKTSVVSTNHEVNDVDDDDDVEDENETTDVLNWSGTHSVIVKNKNYWQPETIEEVETIVKKCHSLGQPVRPIGSALSPNGIAFNNEGMISMANLDNIVKIDKTNNTITAQAGAKVSQVIDELRKYDLTLPNLASIAEQQMGGFVQIGAHGTGKKIAPVDHYVTKLKIVTPSKGTIELTEKDGELFHLAKVGLGCLGIVVEVTMECIPAHNLVEHTFVLTRKEAKEQKDVLLNKHKHVRYMWIPYEDAVVVVTNDPEGDEVVAGDTVTKHKNNYDEKERFSPLKDLLKDLSKDAPTPHSDETLSGMGFGELRDELLAFNPTNGNHIKRVNKAEAEFWRRSEGYQTKPSEFLLNFDCGGQQWVWEVCFSTGTQEENNDKDMDFMDQLLKRIEDLKIPAPAPIEQRWSASSSSSMSPAAHSGSNDNGLFTWVGIINYLPSENEAQRREITQIFKQIYCRVMSDVGTGFKIASHWAKLEKPENVWELLDLRLALQERYPMEKFMEARKLFDPKGILGNQLLNLVFGDPKE